MPTSTSSTSPSSRCTSAINRRTSRICSGPSHAARVILTAASDALLLPVEPTTLLSPDTSETDLPDGATRSEKQPQSLMMPVLNVLMLHPNIHTTLSSIQPVCCARLLVVFLPEVLFDSHLEESQHGTYTPTSRGHDSASLASRPFSSCGAFLESNHLA